MCNLYQMTPKGEVERFIGGLGSALEGVLDDGALWLDDIDPTRPFNPVVGPFGTGLFLRAQEGGLRGEYGQWGMIRPGQRERIDHMVPKAAPGRKPPAPRPRSTNNARIESIDQKPTFSHAWKAGQRCLVPATWYQEPNWETGKNIWWQLKRADGLPWFIAGLWNEWADPQTGELVPNFTMITCNCDGHPLLGRLHKPDPNLPDNAQDKRSLVHIEPRDWRTWLRGTVDEALALVQAQPAEVFDQGDAQRTDAILAAMSGPRSLFD